MLSKIYISAFIIRPISKGIYSPSNRDFTFKLVPIDIYLKESFCHCLFTFVSIYILAFINSHAYYTNVLVVNLHMYDYFIIALLDVLYVLLCIVMMLDP